MDLKIITNDEKIVPGPEADGTYRNARGGTEMMNEQLKARVDNSLLEQFNIIKSRVRHVSNDKPNILWLHDTWDDPESQHLKDADSRKQFSKLVFVSNYQLATYNMALGVGYEESIVLRNAIDPIQITDTTKDVEVIRLIYHTTPHRGLQLLVPAVEAIAKELGNKIHLDVFSSFEAYGWPERDEPYKDLFKQIEEHPQMTYWGYQSNSTVRKALQQAHIFAYPSIWPETSCIAAIEAMSAGCEVVCPNLAALPETTACFANMYQWHPDSNIHANLFANMLYQTIQFRMKDNTLKKLTVQKNYIDNFYNWDLRTLEWKALLEALNNGSN